MATAIFNALQNIGGGNPSAHAPSSELAKAGKVGQDLAPKLDFPEIVVSNPVGVGHGAKPFMSALGAVLFSNKPIATPLSAGMPKQADAIPPRRLEITFFTSDIDKAGTHGAVFMYFGDEQNLEGPVYLTSKLQSKESRESSGSMIFARGSVTTFEVDAKILQLTEIMVGLMPDKSADKWHLLKVVVRDKFSDQLYYFPCEQWLSTTHCGISTEVHLFPLSVDPTEREHRVSYRVTVQTADESGSTCRANPFIAIYGTQGCTGKMWLGFRRSAFQISTSDSVSSAAVRGERATFMFSSFDVGSITRIQVGHDNRGLGTIRWKLNDVEVEKLGRSVEGGGLGTAGSRRAAPLHFVYNGWLGAGNPDGLYEAMLFPERPQGGPRLTAVYSRPPIGGTPSRVMTGGRSYGGCPSAVLRDRDISSPAPSHPPASGSSGLCRYKVWLSTSSTDVHADYLGDAACQVYGSEGKTALLELPGPFKGGSTLEFQHDAHSVGRVEQIMLFAKKAGDRWLLQDVFLEVVNSAAGRTEAYMFSAGDRWFNGFRQPKSIYLKAYDVTQAKREMLKIVTYTSTEKGSATQDGVYLQLTGTESKSRMISLNGGHGAFDRGAVSEFYRSTVTLGQLKTAMLCIDGKKTGTWKPEQLEIIDIKLNKMYIFPCGDWLQAPRSHGSEKEWGRKLLRVMSVSPTVVKDSALKCRYKVLFHTADTENASTRSDISFVLHGDLGESGKVVAKGGAARFNRGQLDATFFEHSNIGEIYKMRLAVESTKPTNWICRSVKVVNLRTGEQSHFAPNGPLATTTGAERSKEILAEGKGTPSGVVHYKVVVSTGNAKESSLSSLNTDISIDIMGPVRTISKALEPEQNIIYFNRGSVDEFDIECPSVGSIEAVVVSLQPRKGHVKWDLKYVEIINMKALQGLTQATGDVAGGVAAKVFGSSVYLENAYGPINTKERTKRRLKRASYPRDFPSLKDRKEEAQLHLLGHRGGFLADGPPEGKATPISAAPALPKPSPLAFLLKLF